MTDIAQATEIVEFKATVGGIIEAAEALEIKDQDSYNAAVSLVSRCIAPVKGIEAFFKKHMDPLKASLDGLRADRDAMTATSAKVREIVERKALAWRKAERERQQEAQAKAEEAARKQAEKEREAEAKRLEREAAKVAKQGTPAALLRIDELQAQAQEIRETPVAPAPVVAVSQIPAGSKAAKAQVRWKFEITDAAQLPREYLIPDEGAIRKVVGALKQNCRISGVRVYSEESLSFGSGS